MAVPSLFRKSLSLRGLCFSCGLPHFIGGALHFSFAEGAFYRKRNRVLTRAFLREHSIFLFYVQRYTQTPDLAVNSDPHRGADGNDTTVDTAAVPKDRAEIVDIGGNKLIEAGRPQPPQAGGFATFGIAVTCRCSV